MVGDDLGGYVENARQAVIDGVDLPAGYWLLYLLGYNMSVAVGAGMIALAGVAVEIGVLMIVYLDQSLKDRRASVAEQDDEFTLADLMHAITDGALKRVRPILMTVATIVLGLQPIMLGAGTGSGVMRRIAAPMVG